MSIKNENAVFYFIKKSTSVYTKVLKNLVKPLIINPTIFRFYRNSPTEKREREFCGRITVLRGVRRTSVRRVPKTVIEKVNSQSKKNCVFLPYTRKECFGFTQSTQKLSYLLNILFDFFVLTKRPRPN